MEAAKEASSLKAVPVHPVITRLFAIRLNGIPLSRNKSSDKKAIYPKSPDSNSMPASIYNDYSQT